MSKKNTFSEKSTKKCYELWLLIIVRKTSRSAHVLLPSFKEIFLLTFQKKCFSWTLRPIYKLAENPKIWHCYYWKCWVMPILVEAVKNDSFLGPMTAGSGNPDFLWSQPLLLVSPVLLVPQSCLKVQWLGCNRCPISWCVLNFMSFDSTMEDCGGGHFGSGIKGLHRVIMQPCREVLFRFCRKSYIGN